MNLEPDKNVAKFSVFYCLNILVGGHKSRAKPNLAIV